MAEPAPYDAFADIYDLWVASAPVCAENRRFYVDECLACDGVVVELGVGNGRIAIEVARRGKAVVGIDSSGAMLDLCRERAREAGVASLLTLVQDDFRSFALDRPARLITIPFHTIGHLTTPDDRRRALGRIRAALEPGGRLVFDHFVFDPVLAETRAALPVLRAEGTDPRTGRSRLLWAVTTYDRSEQTMRVHAISEELGPDGLVGRRRVRRVDFSWIRPEQVRSLLAESGLEVEALYGDFDRAPFDERSRTQVWVARRPGGP